MAGTTQPGAGGANAAGSPFDQLNAASVALLDPLFDPAVRDDPVALAARLAQAIGHCAHTAESVGLRGLNYLSALLVPHLQRQASAMEWPSVRERTEELGVLKAMGFPNMLILVLVLAESCVIAMLGGFIGLGLAWALLQAGNPAPALLPVFYVPDEALMDEARKLAERVAVNPPRTVRLAKRLLREAQHGRLSDVLELSAAFQALAHETRDHKEAVDAFTEKRTPKFTGE